jgi:hypothetical protein
MSSPAVLLVAFQASASTLERALRIQRQRLGDQHPSTASTIRALARARTAGSGPRS